MEIRSFTEKDRDAVAALWKTAFPDDPPHNEPYKMIEAKLKVQGELFFVAESDSRVVGTVMAGYDGHRGWLYLVAVAPDQRRKRIGSGLVRHAVNALKEIGCAKVNLQVRAGNERAVAFFESLGFSIEERVSMGQLLVPPFGR